MKKFIIFFLAAIIFTIIFKIEMQEEKTIGCIFAGLTMGLIFYIPIRIRDYFDMYWIITVIIAIAFVAALVLLSSLIGDLAFLVVIVPFIDMGYSIYYIIKTGRKN